ncbi:redoxin domain-containing protein [Enterobacteriaceae bacterium 4M9]|nr:redoxin domain-containing protein [Enterobacteriaceae bacterium 4M9]
MTLFIAWLGGMLSLLSPCTLPVIPLLFASVQGRRRHLLALFSGMALMFMLVAILALAGGAWAVRASAVGRVLALVLMGIMGLSLLSERVALWVMRPVVWLGNRLDERSRQYGGWLASLLAGTALGLLWAPCAGPVLGAILATAMLHGASGQVGLLLLAYGGGAASVLALLWYSGDALLATLRARMGLTVRLRQAAGILALGAVALIASGTTARLQGENGLGARLEQHLLAWRPVTRAQTVLTPVTAGQDRHTMPPLTGAVQWLNSPPLTPAQLKGKVVLVDFWTFDCINCQHTLPHVREWAEKYRARGLVVIGVHTPEYPWEKDPAAVQRALAKWHIRYPVALDNQYQIWNAFGNQYWPAHYYFDARGLLRHVQLGEGNYAQQEQVIESLLAEAHV